MHTLLRSLFGSLTIVLLSGCGSSFQKSTTTAPAPPSGTYPDLTGNWQVELEPAATVNATTLPYYKLAGGLTGSPSSATVAGTFQFFPTPENCSGASGAVPVPVTGTVDTSNNVHLTFPVATGTGAFDGNLNPTLGDVFGGSQISGGPCSFGYTTALAFQLPSVTGTWTGNLSPTAGAGVSAVTAQLTQATTPSADGSFLLTGTLTSTGSCTGSFTFTKGAIAGEEMQSNPTAASTSAGLFTATAPRLGFFTFPIAVVAFPSCSGIYTGSLTKQ